MTGTKASDCKNADMAHFTPILKLGEYTTNSVYLLLRMTCTDGGEDNSSVHATYHED